MDLFENVSIGMNHRLGISIWYRYRYDFWISVSGIGMDLGYQYRYESSSGYRYQYESSSGYWYRYQGIGGTLRTSSRDRPEIHLALSRHSPYSLKTI